ncbi:MULTISPECIES: phage major capsid protein [Bacillus cereus group]|uniref:phage major capsid protein n=1 Tax=Bacillus cereus group TaxID=86661 RepID=UPI000BF53C4A|nr:MULTISPECIES: phage major capsid protein [Bacillus cereus group]KAB2396794.1 phage major capsid protein [Bacillus cereus]MCU5047020.1 phage major capsid protein [Bacillus cereus]MCU5648372.1 phage major capsid protein [Bacillus cereus]PEP16058.1 phage major capsid protein [Bacillus toyonensis]PHF10026.1 phage major capsid protein [Bacillus wiedmannii]
MKTLQEILTRKSEIRSMLQGDKEVDLAALETELRDLEETQKQIETRQRLLKEAEEINNNQMPEMRTVETFNNEPQKQDVELETSEKRGQALMENRAVTVGSGNVVLPKHSATDIRPTFNEVSTLIDRVSSKTLKGGESYQQPYIKSYGEGDYTTEGNDYNTSETTFGYADITKAKVTAYSEDTEELQKLPAADYDAEVMKGITVATRKKLTREILIGTGATNRLAGIFSAAATAIDSATDLEISAIDASTLDEIVYSYGGDEDVEDAAVLILNKLDLKAFAKLRTSDGKKVYNVVSQGNSGTIDGVPFIINSACKAVSDAKTTAGQYNMAYGPLSNYQLTIFSDMDVQRSTDFKFKQGMIAHRGSVFAGGNVISKNGFLRVKKAATV